MTVLKEAALPTTIFGAKDTNHVKLNDRLGEDGDPATTALMKFVTEVAKP
jgi:hypothetical protein